MVSSTLQYKETNVRPMDTISGFWGIKGALAALIAWILGLAVVKLLGGERGK
jgi:hypothetical protein